MLPAVRLYLILQRRFIAGQHRRRADE